MKAIIEKLPYKNFEFLFTYKSLLEKKTSLPGTPAAMWLNKKGTIANMGNSIRDIKQAVEDIINEDKEILDNKDYCFPPEMKEKIKELQEKKKQEEEEKKKAEEEKLNNPTDLQEPAQFQFDMMDDPFGATSTTDIVKEQKKQEEEKKKEEAIK